MKVMSDDLHQLVDGALWVVDHREVDIKEADLYQVEISQELGLCIPELGLQGLDERG